MEILAYVVDLVHWWIRTMNRSAAFSFVNLTSPVLSFHFNNQRIGILLFKKKIFFFFFFFCYTDSCFHLRETSAGSQT